MSHPDTIVAAATPPGRGGVGIVRVSGPKAPQIAATLVGELPRPRQATLARFADAAGEPIDIGIALFFPAPHSYTGEHVLELQGHGGPVILESLVERCRQLGARRARPGEFTERAFHNDKIDLAQAEAVADLIDAGSREAARAAMRSLQGEFSNMVQGLTDALIDLRTYVEAAIDFPEEEVDFLGDRQLADRLASVRAHFDAVLKAAGQGRLLRDGVTVVLAGRPNSGKSSLLNRLAGYDAAIVTEIPGTTRDVLRERIDIDGLPLHVLDTAGLRESADAVEREGVRRAAAEMGRADRVLFVVDCADDPRARAFEEERSRLPADVPVTLVFNKIDLAPGIPVGDTVSGPPRIHVSALTGAGLEMLRVHLKDCVSFQTAGNGSISARRRHLEALARARDCVETAARELGQRRAGELVAEELRFGQQALEEITGIFTADDLLGRIFSSFCIGK
ncbi:MAG TPA: tRNA uridine-5-carboxymethylaminomethyl(34) synthesis GTPase MnmE [Steroidobacteraceae bacterium]|nr:tRNA uridine-5-carboxymethylaminomethyl(34) synthesis GTPase MnmE [Steroidobacteraceae bacterium]